MSEPVEAPPRWTARANVPTLGDPALRTSAPQEWIDEEDPYHGRSWFTPVIAGVVGLVLVAVLSVGLYLIYRATARGANAPGGESPAPSASSAASPTGSPAPSPSAEPTSEAPPSSEPPPTSAPPAPGPVVVPPLRGGTLAEATVKLQVLGLNVAVERRVDDSVPPGEVVTTIPGEGQKVAPGDTVTLVIAIAPSARPSASSPSPSVSPSGQRR